MHISTFKLKFPNGISSCHKGTFNIGCTDKNGIAHYYQHEKIKKYVEEGTNISMFSTSQIQRL